MTYRFILSLLFVFLTSIIAAPLKALDLSENEIKTLTEGKIVIKPLPQSKKGGFFGGAGFIVVNASLEEVWKALVDYSLYPKIFPRTVDAKELFRKDESSLIRVLLGYKILSVQYDLIIQKDWNKKTITFNLQEGKPHDLDTTKGYWQLIPQPGGRTMVAYVVAVQIPRGISAFLGKSMDQTLENNIIGLPKYLKKWVENSQKNRPEQIKTTTNR